MTMPVPRKKLPARYAPVVMPLILSIVMTFIISGISTLRALGFSRAFLENWPIAWAISWIIAFPLLLALLPIVRRLTAMVVEMKG